MENETVEDQFVLMCEACDSSIQRSPVARKNALLAAYDIHRWDFETEKKKLDEDDEDDEDDKGVRTMVEKEERRLEVKEAMEEFEFSLDVLSLRGTEPYHSHWNRRNMMGVIGLEVGWTARSGVNRESPPWLLGDWVSAARLVRDISGKILEQSLKTNTLLGDDDRSKIEQILAKCPKPKYEFKSDWKNLIRVLPVNWGDGTESWEMLGSSEDPRGDRGEQARIRPNYFGIIDRFSEDTSVPRLLCSDPIKSTGESSGVGWICLPSGLSRCVEFHKGGVPTNLWRGLKDGNRPLKPASYKDRGI